MYGWAKDLFPICRSITGPGVRETLQYIKNELPELNLLSIKSGEQVFDWIVPQEWSIRQAYISDLNGNRIIDFANCNLHVVGYSVPINETLPYKKLEEHLHWLDDMPDAIPYVTSYYSEYWGFCVSKKQKELLEKHEFLKVVIEADKFDGKLDYAELVIKGEMEKEILISTYICHPSMANNELSGPVLAIALAKWLSSQDYLKYTYRVVFVPETIGSIVYISKNLHLFKEKILYGFNLTCVGDSNNYSLLPTRRGNTYIDKVSKYAMNNYTSSYKEYSFLDRGSDERQYSSPLVDLDVVSIMRSKYFEYNEYHTSLDNMTFISEEGLQGSFDIHKKILFIIESNFIPVNTNYCEPQLGKRNLYPKIGLSKMRSAENLNARNYLNMIAYSDGVNSILDIATILNVDYFACLECFEILLAEKIIEKKYDC
jgi:aminopeptidase-like protein